MSVSVLVVDDEPGVREMLSETLVKRGFSVATAGTVEAAYNLLVDAALLKKSPFDVVITDLRLGGWDGLDLLRALPKLSPATRSVLMSGLASARDSEAARALGAVCVLSKPFSNTELFCAIDKAIRRRDSLYGEVHGLSLIDLLQMYHHGRRSLTVDLAGPPVGRIHLREGEIIHATCGGQFGEEALLDLLERPAGFVSTAGPSVDVTPTIDRRLDGLLLELLGKLDERREAERAA